MALVWPHSVLEAMGTLAAPLLPPGIFSHTPQESYVSVGLKSRTIWLAYL